LGKISRPEKNFDDQRWGGPGSFFVKFSKCSTVTPSPKDGRKKFLPWNFGFVEVSQCALPRMVVIN
jgi:hypothetical protein